MEAINRVEVEDVTSHCHEDCFCDVLVYPTYAQASEVVALPKEAERFEDVAKAYSVVREGAQKR